MSEDTEKVVELAKVYVKAGETYINSIKKAQKEVRKQEIEKYEKQRSTGASNSYKLVQDARECISST